MSKKPVIMQVIPNLGAGGAEQTAVDVAAAQVKAGMKAIVVSNGGPRVPEILRCGAQHIQLPVHSKNPFIMALNVLRLRALIRKHDVHIVHARSRAPAWSCLEAVKGTNAHFMTTCHAPYNVRDNKFKRFYNSVIAQGELVIANSWFVGDYLQKEYKLSQKKIRVIPRGIPMEKFEPRLVSPERMMKLTKEWRIPDGAQIILLPGRLTRWKGQSVLIEAMALLTDYPELYCVLLGDDQGRTGYREELEGLIRSKGLEGRVRIAPHCDDMASAYQLASVVVSASIEPEGFGRIAVESQAMGRPTIATNIGGSCETILPNETGWLVPPNDAETLAEALRIALSLPEDLQAAMAAHAMAHVRAYYTKAHMTEATLNVYREILKKTKK